MKFHGLYTNSFMGSPSQPIISFTISCECPLYIKFSSIAQNVVASSGKLVRDRLDSNQPVGFRLLSVLPVLAYLVDSAVRSFAPRGYVYQPRVAAQQLLWEGNAQRSNPNGVA
uniref:Uncharacterized protein n=1 Tax=Candidatus Kentrum sp. TUN TaxID=2126343 RepID=A0A451AKE7_9GAMM|nr:MAG: hypothetical protein BECKTUN1418D_GA0071000_15222 [Candidatus Kentron sp. TUN]